MAKIIRFNDVEISVATFKNVVYLKHTDVGAALEYKQGAPSPKGEPIIVGVHNYYSLHSYENNLRATGKRGDNLVSLLARVRDEYKLQELMPACIDDVAMSWLRSRDEVKAARSILADASQLESELRDEVMKGEI